LAQPIHLAIVDLVFKLLKNTHDVGKFRDDSKKHLPHVLVIMRKSCLFLRWHLDEAANRFKSTWTCHLDREMRFVLESMTGIQQGTRKLRDLAGVTLKERAQQRLISVQSRMPAQKNFLLGTVNGININETDTINGSGSN
jgi:hypothetical protein